MEILIDDISPQINYITTGVESVGVQGTWDNGYARKGEKVKDPDSIHYVKETMSRTTGEGNQAVLEFNGTSISVHGSTWDNHCPYSYQIDSAAPVEKDGWSAGRKYLVELAAATNLEAGRPHTITFTNHPTKNQRPEKEAALGWFDIDYVLLRHDVQGQIRTSHIEENQPNFMFDGQWSNISPEGYSGGSGRQTSAVGSSATLHFTGMSVQVFGGLSSRHGEYTIILDGVGAIRPFSAVMHTEVAGVPLYTASGLQDGPHMLQIVNRGIGGRDAIIDVDYAIVNTTLPEDAPLPAGASSSGIGANPGAASSTGTDVPPLPSSSASGPTSVNTYTLPEPSLASSAILGDAGQAGSAASTNGGSSQSSTPPGVIAGIAVGGAVIIGVLLMAVWFLRRKLQHEERSASIWAASTEQNGTYYGGPQSGGSGAALQPAYGGGVPGQGYRSSRDFGHQGPLRVMNPSQSRTVSLGSRMSSFLGFTGGSTGHGRSPSARDGPGSSGRRPGGSDGYGWEQERDRSFDPFDDMSEINGPSAYVQRIHSPSHYAQQQLEKYGDKGNSVYSGYASEAGSRMGRSDSMRR